jgi:hypothetical protein
VGVAVRAVSVRQPWAWAIARGHQPVLNRSGDTGYRGPVAIYASLRADLGSVASHVVREAASLSWDPADPVTAIGGIITVVSLEGVCAAAAPGGPGVGCACGEWAAAGAYHWQLAYPRPLRWPVLALGQPGLWELAPEVADGLRRFLPDEVVRAGTAG